jgi:hypothetical protein
VARRTLLVVALASAPPGPSAPDAAPATGASALSATLAARLPKRSLRTLLQGPELLVVEVGP